MSVCVHVYITLYVGARKNMRNGSKIERFTLLYPLSLTLGGCHKEVIQTVKIQFLSWGTVCSNKVLKDLEAQWFKAGENRVASLEFELWEKDPFLFSANHWKHIYLFIFSILVQHIYYLFLKFFFFLILVNLRYVVKKKRGLFRIAQMDDDRVSAIVLRLLEYVCFTNCDAFWKLWFPL